MSMPARRPRYSVLETESITKMPEWRAELAWIVADLVGRA